jgi:hypothetical protein
MMVAGGITTYGLAARLAVYVLPPIPMPVRTVLGYLDRAALFVLTACMLLRRPWRGRPAVQDRPPEGD